MGHDHGSEYQLRIALADGREDFTGWLTQDELPVAMAAAQAKGATCWVQVRKLICTSCPDREQNIQEYPVAATGSTRNRPHDSAYLAAAGVRNRSEINRSR
jgi:hypothetical protein